MIYVVECFSHKMSEVNKFDTEVEAIKYMEKDFMDVLNSYNFKFENGKFFDANGDDISDLTFFTGNEARIEAEEMSVDEIFTWKLWIFN